MIVARLVMWLPGNPAPHIKQYESMGEFAVDLERIDVGRDWIQVRVGKERSHEYEERIKASAVVHYRMEIF